MNDHTATDTPPPAPAVGARLEPWVGRLEPERDHACEQGCNGCEDCTDYYCGDEYGDEPHGPPEFGCCLPPGECCMPGLHFPSECHTAADYERRGR